MKWLLWVVGVLIYILIKGVSKSHLNQIYPSDVEKLLSFVSSIVAIGAVVYTYLLVKYIRNFKKDFTVLKIYFRLYSAVAILNLGFSINEFTDIPTDIGDFWGIVILILIITLIIFQFIVSRSLIKIKNDNIGGLKTIGTSLFIFALIDIFLYIIYMVIAVAELVLESLSEEVGEVVNTSISTTTVGIISTLVSLAFSFVIIYLVSQVLKKAELHNHKVGNAQTVSNE